MILPTNIELGSALRQRFNSRLGSMVHKIDLQVQVVFGNKGDNLLVRTMVNGGVRGNTTIEFSRD